MGIQIIWHGHACFSVRCRDYTVVLDPYEDGSIPGLPPLRLEADMVLCSHGHHDHNAVSCVTLRQGRACPFTVTELPTFHDDQGGALRGRNTIRILEADGLRVAHFGDLGCALTPEQEKALQNLDAALIPVGGFFTIGPAEAAALAARLRPRVLIPMHYKLGKTGLPMIAELDDFLALADHVVRWPGNELTLDQSIAPQTAVLSV